MCPPHRGQGVQSAADLEKGTAFHMVPTALPPMEESRDDVRDILSGREDIPEVPCLHGHSVPGKPDDLMAEPAAQETVEQGPRTLPHSAPATTVSPAITMTTINPGTILSGVSTECTLAALSTRLGQQGEEREKDRCYIGELTQQLTETSDQLVYIRKVLDHLISGQTLAPTATSSTTSRPAPSLSSGCLPPGQATSLSGTGIPPVSQTFQ